uniref:Rpn11/EIF3F C-terminal domain-containing protein n=1 Tax=Romanomermis culicivorax TaxID=13658 RepID=A0A915JPW6_ROMCU
MSKKLTNGVDLEKKDRSLCAIFVPIDVEIVAYEPEKVALSLITPSQEKQKTGAVQMTTGLKKLGQSTDQMLNWIEKLKQYIDDVISKKKSGDVNVGRKLNDLVNNATQLQPGQFDNMLNTGMKDFLMITYLAELAKTELKLYEKLSFLTDLFMFKVFMIAICMINVEKNMAFDSTHSWLLSLTLAYNISLDRAPQSTFQTANSWLLSLTLAYNISLDRAPQSTFQTSGYTIESMLQIRTSNHRKVSLADDPSTRMSAKLRYKFVNDEFRPPLARS